MALSAYSVEKLRSVAGGLAKGQRYAVTFPKIPAGLPSATVGKLPYLQKLYYHLL